MYDKEKKDAYYEQNKEKILAYRKEWRETHQEKAKAYAKSWREDPKNKEKIKGYRATRQKLRKADPEKRNEQDRKYRKRAIANGTSIQGWLIKKYGGIPCMDCNGVFPFIAMDFDHRPEEKKEFNIGRFGQYTATPERLSKLMKEVSKCDLVCANCHRIRTQERYK